MIAEQRNLRTRVIVASDAERAWLRGYLSFETGTGRFKKTTRLYNDVSDTFPSGFAPLVAKAALVKGVKLDLLDKRVVPCLADPTADLSWLRDYQHEGVDAVGAKARGILWHPTGSGKTEEAVALGVRYPCRWLFLVNQTYLVNQAAERWELRTRTKAGRIGEGEWSEERFTCATFQTMHAKLKAGDPRALALLKSVEGLIVDEAHTLPADSFFQVAMSTPRAYWRVMFSGTPLARGDQKSLMTIGAGGPVIHRIRPERLIDAGILSRPRIRIVPMKHKNVQASSWRGVYKECIVDSEARNALVLAKTKKAKKPCIVFVKEIEHGEKLNRAIERAGLKTHFVWGDAKTHEREAAVRRLVRGEYDVLVASVVFNVGIDVPALRSMVNAAGGRSAIASIQRVGRGMRIQKDAAGNVVKDEFEVYDFADEGDRWLKRHTAERLKAYQSEGYEVVVEQESPF